MLSESMALQLRDQLRNFADTYPNISLEAWQHKPASGKWSARENLAHLARYHEILLERLKRIQNEETPHFARYRAEDDPKWGAWSGMETQALLTQIRTLRGDVITAVSQLSDEQLARTGIHPVLGEMNVVQWIEFFLLHEAHHLYAILFRLREAA
jgi:uncharacterized damage-inducible protein DinB